MTRPTPPRTWVDPWPTGTVRPDAPRAVVVVAELAVRINQRTRTGGITVAGLAARARLAPSTVQAVAIGSRWPSLETVVRLQDVVGVGELDG